MFWDPYDRNNRERRRLAEEARRRQLAEQEAARRAQIEQEIRRRAQAEQGGRNTSMPPEMVARFEEELARARRERDEWADRYDQLMASLDEQRAALEEARARLDSEVAQQRELLRVEAEQQREQIRSEAEQQRERLLRNAEQRAFEENRKVMLRMVEVADNLARALAEAGDHDSPMAQGLRLTHREFQRALEQSGVEQTPSVGQPFDPALHDAIAARAIEGAEAGTVVAEIAPGFRFRGALLRPARVIVAE